jgi:hypothetical protein
VEVPQAAAIAGRIVSVRGVKVMVDADLASLYGVTTKRFNEAVRRNLGKFPGDFMFELDMDEFAALRSQIATSNERAAGRGGRRYAPMVFTEHGALMAATLLNTPRAVEISVYVVRAFVRLRELTAGHSDLARRVADLERKTEALALGQESFSRETREQLAQVFQALRMLMAPPDPPKRPIGFVHPSDKPPSSPAPKAVATERKTSPRADPAPRVQARARRPAGAGPGARSRP